MNIALKFFECLYTRIFFLKSVLKMLWRPQGLSPHFLIHWKWSAVDLLVDEREPNLPHYYSQTVLKAKYTVACCPEGHMPYSLVNLHREHFTGHQPELYCSWQWCQNEQILRSLTRNAVSSGTAVFSLYTHAFLVLEGEIKTAEQLPFSFTE